jgi:hypothetical protein
MESPWAKTGVAIEIGTSIQQLNPKIPLIWSQAIRISKGPLYSRAQYKRHSTMGLVVLTTADCSDLA